MSTKLAWQFVLSAILSLLFLGSPKSVFATNLDWQLIYPSSAESTAISSPKNENDTVYASIRKWTSVDIIKSTDSGNTWASIKNDLPNGSDINWISFDPRDPQLVLISEYGAGFFRSPNKGVTWEKIYDFSEPRAIEPDLSTANSYFIGGTSGFGTKRVTKVGDVWTIQQLLSGGNSALININQANPEIVFADAGGQYFRSDNYGNTWIQLGLDHPGGVGNIIDGSTVYVGRYDVAEGVYRSTNNGITWVFKNNGLSGKIYSLKYNKKLSYIFASRAHNQGGGIWLSKNSGDSWENVSSTTWANINVWGVEVTDKYVFASVQGLGIYRAELPTNAVSPSPIIFLPGFGGSWSYKGLVENQPTTSADWSLLPFADSYYNPLIQTLKNAGVNPYIFAYDYRKSITDTAVVLNSYIDTVQTANPGQKVNIITHSMGSLVARQCFEKVSGCAAKIDKIITAGGPHQGTLAAYPLWEAGEIDGFNLWTRSAIDLALRATNLPFLTSKDIIQNRFPGVRDLIPPTFVSNPNLQSLTPASSNFSPVVNPLSGNSVPTKSVFTTTTRSVLDVALGLWVDGKPASYSFSPGDGTIAKTSSEILSSTNNKYYDV